MQTTVLLLEEGTALAFVGVIAIVAVCLLGLVLVALVFAFQRRELPAAREPSSAIAPLATSVQVQPPSALGPPTRSARMPRGRSAAIAALQNVEIDVPTRYADAFIHALQASGWVVRDTGQVVATDEDEEALTTLSVDIPADAATNMNPPSSAEEIR